VGVAAATGLAVYAGLRTIDKLSLLHTDVIAPLTARIFPFVRRKVKSYSHSVDNSVGYKLEKELCELLNCIVRNCIESWYNHISECQSPVTDARSLINDVTKLLLVRLANVDRYRFLLKILCLYRQHLNSCRYDKKHNSSTFFTYQRNVSVSEYVVCPDNKQTTDACHFDTVRYLNDVVLMVMGKLLDENSANCVLGKEILTQIIAKEVILRILDIASEPEWLFNIVTEILSDSSNDSFNTVTDPACTSSSTENSDEVQYRSTHCPFNDVVDCDLMQATAVPTATVSENAVSTRIASLNDEQFLDSADAVSVLCNYEHSLLTARSNDSDVNMLSDSDVVKCNDSHFNSDSHADKLNDSHLNMPTPAVKSQDVAAVVSDHEVTPHVPNFSDPYQKDSRRSSSSSECSSVFERKMWETSVVGNGYNQQLDDGDISPELSSHNTTSQNPLSSLWKKRSSLARILPSFKTQDSKEKAVDHKSAYSVVYQMPGDVVEVRTEEVESGIKSTPASAHTFGHKKTKSFSSTEKDADVKPHISHSSSMTVLGPESGSDAPAGFLSRFVRRFSTGMVRIPLFKSGSSSLLFVEEDSTSDTEFESVSDLEASATEASEDFLVDHQPDFLFNNIRVSVPERDGPVSKPYTFYVISVRIIQTFFSNFLCKF